MADSLPDLRAALFAGLLLLPVLAQAAAPRAVDRAAVRASNELTLDGTDMQIDYRANTLHLRNVTISQGPVRIQAQEATANGVELSFDDSRWVFSGEVRIRFQDGNLDADSATVTFTGNRIARATVVGKPAKFEQKLPNLKAPARGRANTVDYDVLGGGMRLSGDAWFSDGRSELNTQALVYNTRTRFLESDNAPGETGRVHMTIRPKEADEPAGPQPAGPPPAGPQPAAPAPP